MKKIAPAVMVSLLCAGLSACGNSQKASSDSASPGDDATSQALATDAKTSPDLAFFNLQGNVKTLTYTSDCSVPLLMDDQTTIEFDENGNCPKLMDYLYLPEDVSQIEVKRNSDGELVEANNPDRLPTPDSPGDYEFNWNNGRLYRATFEGWEIHEEYTFSYSEGVISTIDCTYSSDGGNGNTIVNLSEFQFDDKGNWTRCKASVARTTWDHYMEGEEPEKETEPIETITISRTITYF